MFDGKLIIITGGSSGIGKNLGKKLISKGANLALIARDENKLRSVQDELVSEATSGQKIEALSCDVADANAVEQTIRSIADKLGSPDILINSAGILRESYFEKQSLEMFHEVMDINFFGTLHCIKAVLPFFKEKGGGRIVNICSMAGLIGCFGYSAYCSSKYAIAGLTNTLRQELLPQNINFHIVYPPEFESPMVDEVNTYRTIENQKVVHSIPTLDLATVTDAVIRGVERGQYEIITGKYARLIARIEKMFPSISRLIVDRTIRKHYRGPDK